MARKRQSPRTSPPSYGAAESGVPIAKLARNAGVHENTVHFWKKKIRAA
jgi:hypothetical protein